MMVSFRTKQCGIQLQTVDRNSSSSWAFHFLHVKCSTRGVRRLSEGASEAPAATVYCFPFAGVRF